MAAATIKYTVKTATMTQSGTGPLFESWPHLLISIGDADAREIALAEARAVHERLLAWEAEQAAKAAPEVVDLGKVH